MIYEDQLAAVKRDSERKSAPPAARSTSPLLTDGLKAEREQGITIDVAYRYFSTDRRKFIIADTPGHEQYTRNMATGASTCDLAIILIDARHGVHDADPPALASSCRCWASGTSSSPSTRWTSSATREEVFERIKDDYTGFVAKLDLRDVTFIPMSALKGDNVVDAERRDAVVPRPAAAGPPGDGPHRQRPQPDRPALPGAVRHPPQPRLPRLRRHGRVRHRPQGRRGHGAAVGQAQPGEVDRDLRRRAGRRRSRRRR